VHPLEYLRMIARDPASGDRPWEAASAFAVLVTEYGLGGSEAVPTARRLLERISGRPELWWAASRILGAVDEGAAAREVLEASSAQRPASGGLDAVVAALCDPGGGPPRLLVTGAVAVRPRMLVPLGALLPAGYADRLLPAIDAEETHRDDVTLVCERLRGDGRVTLVESPLPRADCPFVTALV